MTDWGASSIFLLNHVHGVNEYIGDGGLVSDAPRAVERHRGISSRGVGTMLNFDIGPECYALTWREMGRPVRLRGAFTDVLVRVIVCVVLVFGVLAAGVGP